MSQFLVPDSFPTAYYTDLLKQLYSQNEDVLDLYPNATVNADFETQIQDRSDFPMETRKILVDRLLHQYNNLEVPEAVNQNIQSLLHPQTFTITTGQQIHLFLGPMYVIYKALSTIWHAKRLKNQFPHCHFVPVFWMATEDHDFDEIRNIRLFGKEFIWQKESQGPVGRFDLEGIDNVISEIQTAFAGDPKVALGLEMFVKAYKRNSNLADATRDLLNQILGKQGLVVLDPDDAELKRLAVPLFIQDIETSDFEAAIANNTLRMQQLGLSTSIPSRSPNLFVFKENHRFRLDKSEDGFVIKGQKDTFSKEELMKWLNDRPEDFSPNVALRPLYQETILPNLAYVAGPGEITYWFQIGNSFKAARLPQPILVPRHSFVSVDEKSIQWLLDNHIDVWHLLQDEETLKSDYFKAEIENSPIPRLQQQLENIEEELAGFLYQNRNPELKEVKKVSGNLLKLLIKAQTSYVESVADNPKVNGDWTRMKKIKSKYFNISSPQERIQYFIENWIQNPSYIHNFNELPNIEVSPLSVVYSLIL